MAMVFPRAPGSTTFGVGGSAAVAGALVGAGATAGVSVRAGDGVAAEVGVAGGLGGVDAGADVGAGVGSWGTGAPLLAVRSSTVAPPDSHLADWSAPLPPTVKLTVFPPKEIDSGGATSTL